MKRQCGNNFFSLYLYVKKNNDQFNRRGIKTLISMFSIFMFLTIPSIVFSLTINFSDNIYDSEGIALNKTIKMKFSIYNDDGELKWKRFRFVTVNNGKVNIDLGKRVKISESLFDNHHYLEAAIFENNNFRTVGSKLRLKMNGALVVDTKKEVIDSKNNILSKSSDQKIEPKYFQLKAGCFSMWSPWQPWMKRSFCSKKESFQAPEGHVILFNSVKLINESINIENITTNACTKWEGNWQGIVPGLEMPEKITLRAQARKGYWPAWAHCRIEGYYVRVPEPCNEYQ